MRKKILIDTDISLGTPRSEIDDGAALSFLMASPNVEIIGISTVHGNSSAALSENNAHRHIRAFGMEDVSIVKGAERPLVRDEKWEKFLDEWQAQYGKTNSIKFLENEDNVTNFYYQKLNQFPEEISIVCLGPLTNIANLITQRPEIVSRVKSLYIMGGDRDASQAEFNIRCDPEAAKIVFSQSWGIYAYGLSVTRKLFFSRNDFDSLSNNNQAVALLKSQSGGWINIIEENGWEIGGCSLHDAVPAIAFLHPELFEYYSGEIQIDCSFSENRGKTQINEVDSKNTSHKFARNFDIDFVKSLLLKRLSEF
jgi:inosine-uridine nucleoside N-ribohydrolase